MGAKTKVLQIHQDFNVRSSPASDLGEQIFMALPAERYETTSLYLYGKPHDGDAVSRADHSIYLDLSKKQLRGLRLRAMWSLFRACRSGGYDVVICNRFKPLYLMLSLSRWLPRTRFIGVVHGMGDYNTRSRRRRVRTNMRDGWCFVGVSEAVKAYMEGLECGFTEENTIAITNAIDVDAIRLLEPDEARRAADLPTRGRVVGAIGRLVPVKGHDVLIRAFARVSANHPGAVLAILGSGRRRAHLDTIIAELGLEGKVRLTGAIPEAMRYTRAFDIYVIPSLSEGLGLSLLEALNGGCPVIGSALPALSPIIDGAGGTTFPPGDEVMLAKVLDRYLSLSDEQLAAKGRAARAYLQEHHGIDEFREQYRRLIDGHLKTRQ